MADIDVGKAAEALNATAKNATTISAQEQALAYGALYAMAILSILFGAFRSVTFVQKHRTDKKLIENSISTKDAKMFPFTASGVLFSLYIFFKYNDQVHEYLALGTSIVKSKIGLAAAKAAPLAANGTANATATGITLGSILSKNNLSYLLMVLIVYEGCFAMAHLLKPLFSRVIYMLPLKADSEIMENLPYQLKLDRAVSKGAHERKDLINWEFDTHDMISLACCALVGIGHVIKKNWITNNLLGMSFCVYGIEALHLSSFKGGVWLLSGLFVYDIFWVFATDVMTTVATNISAPILLQFPQDILQNGFEAKKYAMLGLGDIVIPGIFLALLLRFSVNGMVTGKAKPSPPSKIYFTATMVAYAAGLFLTIGVMHWFKAAQPALLYLVPACVGAPCLLAAVRGEFSHLLQYSEEELVKKEDEYDEKKKKN